MELSSLSTCNKICKRYETQHHTWGTFTSVANEPWGRIMLEFCTGRISAAAQKVSEHCRAAFCNPGLCVSEACSASFCSASFCKLRKTRPTIHQPRALCLLDASKLAWGERVAVQLANQAAGVVPIRHASQLRRARRSKTVESRMQRISSLHKPHIQPCRWSR
jgi:hypothetical protein